MADSDLNLDLEFDGAARLDLPGLADRARRQAHTRRRIRLAAGATGLLLAVGIAAPLLASAVQTNGQEQLATPPQDNHPAPPVTVPTASPTGTPLPPPAVGPSGAAVGPSAAAVSPSRASATGRSAAPSRRAGSAPPASARPSTAAPPSSIPPTTTTTARALPITAQVVAQLVAAKAAASQLPPSDYTGVLTDGYAYDPATNTFWAAGAVTASDSSVPAQVTVNDQGGYDVFRRTAGGSWTAYDVGTVTGVGVAACGVAVPATIDTLWGWAPGACRPPHP